MIKKVVALIITLSIVASLVPAFAAEGGGSKERSLWKIIADSFEDFEIREQDKIRTAKTFTLFQDISDNINEGAESARDLSLRGTK